MDAQVFWDAPGANSCWHGVTTVVMGNCGFTLAPVRSDERALVVRNLERAEDIDPARARRRHRLELGDVPRVPRRRRPAARRASTTPPTSATRRCAPGRWASARSSEAATDDDLARMTRPARRRAARRRDRLHHVAQRAPRDVRRPAGRVAARGVGRGRAARRRDGRPRRRHLRRRPTACCSPPTPSERERCARARMRELAVEHRRADDDRHRRHRSRRPRAARLPRRRRRRRRAR